MSSIEWLAGAGAAALLVVTPVGGATTTAKPDGPPPGAPQSIDKILDEVAKQFPPVRHGPRARRPRGGGFLGEFQALRAMHILRILEAYPAMTCNGDFCQISKPSRRDCLGDLPCSSLSLRIDDGKVSGLRMAIPSGIADAIEATIRRSAIHIRSDVGPLNSPGCYGRRLDGYRMGTVLIGFESVTCSGLAAAMYGSATTMILSGRLASGRGL